ncbi:NADH-quinone oxidoreductase subunit NuoN [Candidatus Tisiphia endosymbiont of Temnostethus pusillus]|uniref:NADH-quinone oxidoreductase subunit NuoN n=1 Tax=Candidatus Tisiphia endosymbiont of Temnostethus pusillus TaxID=3139335 RepID=UPI0035C8DB25
MTDPIFKQFIIILPELYFTLFALLYQLFMVLSSRKTRSILNIIIWLMSIFFMLFMYIAPRHLIGTAFHHSIENNSFTSGGRFLVIIFAWITMIIYHAYCKITGEEFKSEFNTLVILSTVGICITISARNFLLLFVAMELQALVAYVLAGFNLNNIKASEGALKYFILGSLISCLTLFGISFIYGFGGSLDYSNIFQKLNHSPQPNIGLIVGLVLFLSGILFKLSAAPLHSWTLDVYEGSPVPSITYFSAATKIGNVVVLLNIMTMVIGDYKQISVDLIKITAILSMLIGAAGAIRQTSLKRLMGYSTILNIGYVLMAISFHTPYGDRVALLYMVIYAASVIGFFACLITLLGKKSDSATFDDIKGLASTRKALAAGIAIIMFSMIGIPPLAGFLAKYSVFYQAIIEKQFTLAFIAIGTSVVAAYYYLKIVRSMYFFEASKSLKLVLVPTPKSLKFICYLIIGVLLLLCVFIQPLADTMDGL